MNAMKNSSLLVILLVLVLISVGAYLLQSNSNPKSSSKPQVAATIFPLYDMVRIIAGDDVQVDLILEPGASPHTFEPTPQLIRNTQEAKIVFAIGHGLDDWSLDLVDDPSVVEVVDDGIALRETADDDDEHGPIDPHYWLTAQNAQQMSLTIAAALTRSFPEFAKHIDENVTHYSAELKELDAHIKTQLSTVTNKSLITFHDAWYYFADAYGLTLVGTFEPTVGREPTPKYLANLSELIQTSGVNVLYAEPQFSSAAMRAFLSNQNVTIATIDPEGSKHSRSYIDLMTQNADTIAQNQ